VIYVKLIRDTTDSELTGVEYEEGITTRPLPRTIRAASTAYGSRTPLPY